MKRDKVMIDTATRWSLESYCRKRQVGAVIAKDGHIIATGFNGTVSGMKNDCEETVAKCLKCEDIRDKSRIGKQCPNCDLFVRYKKYKKSSEFVIHAEQNAILDCAKRGISTQDATMYCTHGACKNCAKLIAGAGIVRFVHLNDYKDLEGVAFLKKCGIEVIKLK